MHKRILAITALQFLLTTTYALPLQIDLVGIVPGVTTLDQLNARAQGHSTYPGFDGLPLIEIGGYRSPCDVTGLNKSNNTIDSLACIYSEPLTEDVATTPPRHVFSNEIYRQLVDGLSKKFGKPHTKDSLIVMSPASRKQEGIPDWAIAGVPDLPGNSLFWFDQAGNRLYLVTSTRTLNVNPPIGRIKMDPMTFLFFDSNRIIQGYIKSSKNAMEDKKTKEAATQEKRKF